MLNQSTLLISCCAAATLCSMVPPMVVAQTNGGEQKRVQIVQVDEAPAIDGRLDDEVWSQAAMVDDLHQIEPNEYAPPSERTQVFLLYDEEALYIGARSWDSEPERITAHVLRQGEVLWTEDTFAVIVDPLNNRRSGFRFEVNPNGVRREGQFQNTSDLQEDWEGIWRAAATQDADGWVAEMAIPFKTLPFDPGNDEWGINFARRIARKNEQMGWVSRNRDQDPSISGRMLGIAGIEQGRGLDVLPSVSLRGSRSNSPKNETTALEPSLDLFYKVTPLLNGSLTLNTDFSATEVDDRQVNLTRFRLFFPEKREFFLKDADIFTFGRVGNRGGDPSLGNTAASRTSRENGRPFFSRSIGLSGSGQPVDLDVGGKLSGRVGQWNLGALAIRQDQFQNVEPTNVFVGRAAANILAESSVGFMATSGDPQSNLDNSVVGVDFNYLNTRLPSGRALEGEAWYQQSDTEGLDTDDAAFGVGLRLPSRSGLRGELGFKELEANFNPALGFVNNSGIRDSTMSVGYTHRLQASYLRAIFSGVDAQRIELLGGGLQTEVVRFRIVELENNLNEEFGFHYTGTREALTENFEISEGVIIPPGQYSFESYGFAFETGVHRKLSAAVEYESGDFFEGEQQVIEAVLTWRPSPHFQGGVGYEYNDIELPQGAFVARLVRIQAGIAFSSTLSWVNLIQYDSVSDSVGVNSRLHWIPEAGREAFFVLNHNLEQRTEDSSFHSATTDVVVKLGYLFRF